MVNVKPSQTPPMPEVKSPKTPPTDYEKFKKLFGEIGCGYITHLEPDRIYIIETDSILADGDLGVEFDRQGKFKRFVIW